MCKDMMMMLLAKAESCRGGNVEGVMVYYYVLTHLSIARSSQLRIFRRWLLPSLYRLHQVHNMFIWRAVYQKLSTRPELQQDQEVL